MIEAKEVVRYMVLGRVFGSDTARFHHNLDQALRAAYSRACEVLDPPDSIELGYDDYDVLFGAFMGGAMGVWREEQDAAAGLTPAPAHEDGDEGTAGE